jgi:acetyltransferase-like isoleucine patch superfamily enzyme
MRNVINKLIVKWKNRSCEIGRNVIISRHIIVGYKCKIAKYARLTKTVILGDNVEIGENTHLSKISIGDFSVVESGVKVVGTRKGRIKIGNHCYIGLNNVLDTSDNISIGNFVHIAGPSTALWCHSSAKMCLNNIPVNDKGRDKFRPTSPINIENNVYIGGNCTIYPGVTIGHHSIIGPNSAVTKSFPPNSLIGGVPAIKIREISSL